MKNVVVFCCFLTFGSSVGAETPVGFNRDVRPILSDACFHCHGPDAAHREADLRLDVDEGQEVVLSDLIDRITSDDPDAVMPPPDSGKSLDESQIEIFRRWVDQGAPYEAYWAYVEPEPASPPPLNGSLADWPLDSWDQFIAFGMGEQNLSPARDATPETLLRRVTFDLTGLPPTPEAVQRFVADPSNRAYQRYVDELLASPAFGERMAVYWLDLVRFADTVGYHGDQDHNVSPYRDYVIDSFNRNLPFDQFTIEQIAGDLLPEPSQDQLIASCYNRLLQTSHEGGVQPKEYLAIYAADRVRNLSVVWMGATVGCAQCHDHKYDPFTARDFYTLSAFFADLDEAQHFKSGTNSLPTRREPEINVLARWQRDWMQSIEQQLRQVEPDSPTAVLLMEQKKRLESSRRKTMISKSIAPRETRVLPRGNWLDDSGEVVQPEVPHFMKALQVDRRASRLDLARWLVDSERGVGGLTARVLVNRLWYLVFGRGLSSSLDDFGGQGEPPTHPELLDQLALDLIRGGWDIKRFVRRMVMTRAYRQSSVVTLADEERDPYNHWFARQSRHRLPAEMVRDAMLEVSGLTVHRVGGASVKPYQPAGYYRHLNFPTRKYRSDSGAAQWRRGVYVHWQRQFLHPVMKALDAPSREECTAKRSRSNTPLEALALLNDQTAVESAVAMAARLLEGGTQSNDETRLRLAFTMATSRVPDATEMSQLTDFLARQKEVYLRDPQSAKELIGSCVNLPTNEWKSQPETLAAWSGVCRAILNLYETVSRN